MHKVMVEVLDNNGSVLTSLINGSAVEAVKNINVKARMMVSTATGHMIEIEGARFGNTKNICIRDREGNLFVGLMSIDEFIEIYM